MADNVTNELIYELLKRMHSDLSFLRDDMHRLEGETRSIKGHIVALMQNDLQRDADIASLRADMDRVKQRLELVDQSD